jgi:hypothetical protein
VVFTPIHHHPAVLAIGDLHDERRDAATGQFEASEPACLVVGLHLGDEFGVVALRLDESVDARGLGA